MHTRQILNEIKEVKTDLLKIIFSEKSDFEKVSFFIFLNKKDKNDKVNSIFRKQHLIT